MKAIICLLLAAYSCTSFVIGKNPDLPPIKEINMDIVASDGVKLKATFYTSGKPGPGMLLLHQCNMDRKSWKTLATSLAQHGVHVLTFDYRGYGETPNSEGNAYAKLPTDIDATLTKLLSQPGVDKLKIGAGGASCSVNNAVLLAKRNSKIKTLMLLSGPVSPEGITYLQEHPELALFGAASSEEEFAIKAIREAVATSKNPFSKMTEVQNAGHGAPMFSAEPSLLRSATEWIVKMLK